MSLSFCLHTPEEKEDFLICPDSGTHSTFQGTAAPTEITESLSVNGTRKKAEASCVTWHGNLPIATAWVLLFI